MSGNLIRSAAVLFVAMLLLTSGRVDAVSGSLNASGDSFVSLANSEVPNGAATTITTVGANGAAYTGVLLIKFDISTFPPAEDVISATLRVYCTSDPATKGGRIRIFRLTSAWVENSATFKTYDGTNAWTGGADIRGELTALSNDDTSYDTENLASVDGSGADISAVYQAGAFPNDDWANGYVDIDITTLVNDWHNGTYPNNGVAVAMTGTVMSHGGLIPDYNYGGITMNWASRESANQPQLVYETGSVFLIEGTQTDYDDNVRDNTYRSEFVDPGYGYSSDWNNTENRAQISSTGIQQMFVVWFDLTGIPVGSDIVSATFSVFCGNNSPTEGGNYFVGVFPDDTVVVNSSCWLYSSDNVAQVPWSSSSPLLSAREEGTKPNVRNWIHFDVTDALANMVLGTEPNNGFAVWSDATVTGGRFYSREVITGISDGETHPHLRPKLSVRYGAPGPGTVSFQSATASVNEDAGTVTLNVARVGGILGAITVNYATANGTATAGSDYTAATGSVSWADGELGVKTITVNITDDTLFESGADETFTVTLSGAAELTSPTVATVSIADNDGPGVIAFSAATYSVSEGAGTVTITATRTGGSAGAIDVDYATANGTAIAGTDYTAATGTLSWANGDTANKTIVVLITNNLVSGTDTTFTVALSNYRLNSVVSADVVGTPATATVTIMDDDGAGRVQFDPATYTISEGAGTVTLTVTRISGSTGAVSVDYATVNGTAVSGTDYTTRTGTLNWAAGDTTAKTFTVPIVDNLINSPSDVSFTVTLSNPQGGVILGTAVTATVTITDNDSSYTLNGTITVAGLATGTVVDIRLYRVGDVPGTSSPVASGTATTAAGGAVNWTLNATASDGNYFIFFDSTNYSINLNIVGASTTHSTANFPLAGGTPPAAIISTAVFTSKNPGGGGGGGGCELADRSTVNGGLFAFALLGLGLLTAVRSRD